MLCQLYSVIFYKYRVYRYRYSNYGLILVKSALSKTSDIIPVVENFLIGFICSSICQALFGKCITWRSVISCRSIFSAG